MRAAPRVLDSYSLIAYLEGEAGAEKMIELFRLARDSGRDLLVSVINWGEVYYVTLREAGRERADEVAHLIATLPIEVVLADLDLTRQAADFKSSKKMSYADCFAAALAKARKAELVTGDKEFRQVDGEVKILWIS
ncbi:MAG: type II toxin-antitoxin system VapC family toxin [candidate division NC10 bacterium]|nr:type II toxin-antitoxin system VapC family toxin [candidate division NC10 bacterium]MDE2320620.1 type II toxin-antitoxin system VapC family toxin [candidate division NC10 bacterium]